MHCFVVLKPSMDNIQQNTAVGKEVTAQELRIRYQEVRNVLGKSHIYSLARQESLLATRVALLFKVDSFVSSTISVRRS